MTTFIVPYYTPIDHKGVATYECSACGALTVSPEKHTRWHEEQVFGS